VECSNSTGTTAGTTGNKEEDNKAYFKSAAGNGTFRRRTNFFRAFIYKTLNFKADKSANYIFKINPVGWNNRHAATEFRLDRKTVYEQASGLHYKDNCLAKRYSLNYTVRIKGR